MTQSDNSRPIGTTPITDAAAATAPSSNTPDSSTYASVVHDDNDSAQTPTEQVNSEQDDEDAQAQTVADDAIRGIADKQSGEESEHGGATNPAQIDPDDAQDLVDHMKQMETSGRIDMDAYRGERSDDDEPDTYGEAAMEPDDVDSHGNRPKDSF